MSKLSLLEHIVRHFRSRPGLYMTGAGTSTGAAPRGKDFWTGPPLAYARGGGYPVDIPSHDVLAQRMIDESRGLTLSDVYPDRVIRPGSDEFPTWEMLQRLPDFYARWLTKHRLAIPRFYGWPNDAYRVFRHFHPSLIANYNHDGLAAYFCRDVHRVIDVHGTIEPSFGSPEIADFLERARDYDLPITCDGLLMGVPEPRFDPVLTGRLLEIAAFSPAFVAIIGYSFARSGKRYDDQVSLDFFLQRFRSFRGNIYIIEPKPAELTTLLADALRSKTVFPVPAYWNVLAHAIMQMMRHPARWRSLNYAHELLLDRHGSDRAFPTPLL